MPRQPKRAKRGYAHYFRRGKIEIDEDTGCWIWLGAQNRYGYGVIRRWLGDKWSTTAAHRYFYELYRGPLPRNHDAGHNCHRRRCVKLRHIVPELHADNMRLMFEPLPLSHSDIALLRKLHFEEDRTVAYIADRLMAPRPLIYKAIKTLSPLQDDLPF